MKPVVVSMGNVASGGYWIVTDAKGFSEPNTITGSIGVFGLLLNFKASEQQWHYLGCGENQSLCR